MNVGVVRELGDPDAEEAHTTDQTSSAFARAMRTREHKVRSYLVVRIGRGMAGHTPAGALGSSLPDAQYGVSATIFEDRIEGLWESNGTDLAVVLGHAIAHELGHVLLGSAEHSSMGIMRAHWGKADFDQAAMGRLGFTAQQAARIRNYGGLLAASQAVRQR